MELSAELRLLIKQSRNERGLTLAQLSNLCDVGISTLSSLESGSLKNIKYETLVRITRELKIQETDHQLSVADLKVGFGHTLWAAPLINLMVNKAVPDDIDPTCFFDENGQPHFGYNPADKGQDSFKVYTAYELIDALESNLFDCVFLPSETVSFKTRLVRVCRIMDTVKGGVQILVVGKKDEIERMPSNKIIETIRDEDEIDSGNRSCGFYFPKGTIAEIEVRRIFPYVHQTEEYLDVTDLSELPGSEQNPVDSFFTSKNRRYVLFAGWDVNIFKIKENIENSTKAGYACRQFGSYEFYKKNEPFKRICLDLIVRKEDVKSLKTDKRFFSFFEALRNSIDIVNESKNKPVDYHISSIANWLKISPQLAREILHLIGFEISFYPDWVL